MTVFVKDKGAWHEIGGAAGLPGLGGWAEITATTGSPTKHEYTDADGNDWTAYEFTVNGTVTTTIGLVDCLLVSGASVSVTRTDQGGHGGGVNRGVHMMPAGAHTVTVGAGGGGGSRSSGSPSLLGPITGPTAGLWGDYTWVLGYPLPSKAGTSTGNGGFSDYPGVGVMDDITGVNKGYGGGANADPVFGGGNPPRANSGAGRTPGIFGDGAAGVVIIRVPRANAKA